MPSAGLQEKTMKNKNLGDAGEEIAARYLQGQGFEILGRNLRYRRGELDIVAQRRGELHFIEVRTRSGAFLHPFETITEQKKARLRRAAEAYLLDSRNCFRNSDPPPCYFGVIGIDYSSGSPQIECLLDAFC